jgi:predicted ATPase/transcriptional regulator with XRE-family HTH domain
MVKKAAQATPNRLIRAARKERGWTQQQVADLIGAPLSLNISRWESGTAFPSAYYLEKLCQLFGKSIRELGLSQLEDETKGEQAPPQATSFEQTPSWAVPQAEQEETMLDDSLTSTSTYGDQEAYRADLMTFRDDTLPLSLTSLIGREQDVVSVCSLLRRSEVRLVTLTGVGGIGKTRLALRVADELRDDFADGVVFVSLAALRDPTLVVPTIVQSLGLKETEQWSSLDLLQMALREKQQLLLLDNFERLVQAAPQLVDLLTRCPQLQLLVTSRAILQVQGEYEFQVSPLALPKREQKLEHETLAQYSAVVLFIQRAQTIKADFQLTAANAPAIAEICLRLDGIPLALELAAARIKLLSPQELLVRLEHRLAMLTGGSQDLPVRQQTLRNTLLWSYQLLSAWEQHLFRLLSVFVGGCTLEAVETVYADLIAHDSAYHFLDDIASLVSKSLLHTSQQDGEPSRLLLLETIREYGLECLEASGEMELARCAHAKYYLWLAEEAELHLPGPRQAKWLACLEREYSNLRAALQWFLDQAEHEANHEMPLRLAAALREFWLIRGHLSEGRAVLDRALANSEGVEARYLAKAFATAGSIARGQGDFGQAELWIEKSLALSCELGDTRGRARALRELGNVAMLRGENGKARALLEEGLTLFRELDNTRGISDSLVTLADVFLIQGEYSRACSLLEESLASYRKAGLLAMVAQTLNLLASAVFYQGDMQRAHALLGESLALARDAGDKDSIAYALILRGLVNLTQGETTTAQTLLEEGLVLARLGGWRERIAWGIYGLGWNAFFERRYETARSLFEEGLELCNALGNQVFVAFYLEGLASVIALLGQQAQAARLWGAVEQLRTAIDAAVPPVMQLTYEQFRKQVQSQLGEEAFSTLWNQGRTMTPDQVLTVEEPALRSVPSREESHQFHEH